MAIKHKRTSTASYAWQATDLAEGQIGLNIADGTLHFKKTDNTIVALSAGGGGGGGDVVSDTTPQLGGDLDVNGKKITSLPDTNVVIEPGLNSNGNSYLFVGSIYDNNSYICPPWGGNNNLVIAGQSAPFQGPTNYIRLRWSNNLEIVSNDSIELTPGAPYGAVIVGSLSTDAKIYPRNGNLRLGYPGVNSEIVLTACDPVFEGPADVQLNPYGTGHVKFSGISLPNADGTNGQALTTDGAGVIGWTSVVSLATLKSVVAASTDFADFQSRIAAL